jgi:hypothetical protein
METNERGELDTSPQPAQCSFWNGTFAFCGNVSPGGSLRKLVQPRSVEPEQASRSET